MKLIHDVHKLLTLNLVTKSVENIYKISLNVKLKFLSSEYEESKLNQIIFQISIDFSSTIISQRHLYVFLVANKENTRKSKSTMH